MIFSTTLTLAASLAADVPATTTNKVDFVDLAPPSSMLVIAADDVEGMVEKFNGLPLKGLLGIDAVKDLLDTDGRWGELMTGLEGAGMEQEDMAPPTAMGLSVYVDLDEETGQSRAFLLGYADWGKDVEKAQNALDIAFKSGREMGAMELDQRDVRGREVYVVTSIMEEEDPDDFDDFNDMMMFGDPTTMLPNTDTMYIVRDNTRFLMANDLLAIDDALATFDGDGGDSLRDTEDWQEISAMLGGPDVYMVMRFEPLADLMAPMMMGPLGMAQPMMEEFFGGMRGIGGSFNVSDDPGADGMIESRVAVYAPGEKAGALSLLRDETPIDMNLPKMIPADAISFSRINVEFKDIIPMVRDMTAAMPMGGEEIENGLDMYEPSVKPALDTLGPAVYVYSTLRRPVVADSSSMVALVPAGDPDRVHPLLATVGPSMGLQPRDFKGETIWSDDIGGGSLAVAGNWMFAGDARGVEQAIRSMDGNPDSLSDNSVFENSLRRMPNRNVVAWGWSDTVEQYAAQRESFKQMMGMMGGFDEFAPEDAGNDEAFDLVTEFFDELSPEDMASFVGPGLWTVTAPESGWLYTVWMLPPFKQAG